MKPGHKRTSWKLVVVLCVAGTLMACGDSGSSGSSKRTDAGAELACTHFRNSGSDYAAGILTYAEMRTKLQQVNNDARVADAVPVRTASERLLAAWTQGVGDTALASYVTALGNACTNAGF